MTQVVRLDAPYRLDSVLTQMLAGDLEVLCHKRFPFSRGIALKHGIKVGPYFATESTPPNPFFRQQRSFIMVVSRNQICGLILGACWLSASAFNSASANPTPPPTDGDVVAVPAQNLFAPIGFDDNDAVTVVVDGFLPSGCYRLDQPNVLIDPESKKVTITPRARFFDHPCIEVLVPYWQEVNLGVLSIGEYKIEIPSSNLQETMLVTEAPSAGPDDYLYAAIDAAAVDRAEDSTDYVVKLQGRFTNTCMVLTDIRVIDTGKSINVLPIMAMEDRDDCRATEVQFRRMVPLPTSVTKGRHLLHVRSLNGQAVNYVFSKT